MNNKEKAIVGVTVVTTVGLISLLGFKEWKWGLSRNPPSGSLASGQEEVRYEFGLTMEQIFLRDAKGQNTKELTLEQLLEYGRAAQIDKKEVLLVLAGDTRAAFASKVKAALSTEQIPFVSRNDF